MSDTNQQWLLKIKDISPDPKNPRSDFHDLTELAASIDTYGVIQAVTVRAARKEDIDAGVKTPWVLVEGERRWRASQLAKREEIPAVRYDLVEQDPASVTLELSLIANMQRSDLTPIEMAKALQDILDTGKESVVAVAKRIGRSEAWVRRRITLLELPEVAQRAINEGSIPLDAAPSLRTLVGKVPPDVMETIVKDCVRKRLNTAGINALITPYLATDDLAKKAPKVPGPAPKAPAPPQKTPAPAAPKAPAASALPSLPQSRTHSVTQSRNAQGLPVVIVTCCDDAMAEDVTSAVNKAIEAYLAEAGEEL